MANPYNLQQQRPQLNLAQVRTAPSQQNGARIRRLVLPIEPMDEEKSFTPAPRR